MKIAGGITQDGVVIGNSFDKYGSRNPLVRWMMNGFDAALSELVRKLQPAEIHEVGCGEGYWTMRWAAEKIAARGSDFSSTVIDIARANAAERGLPAEMFSARSIYDLDPATDAAELVVCCEVLEHLEHPEKALERLSALARPHLILSVPREPLWSGVREIRPEGDGVVVEFREDYIDPPLYDVGPAKVACLLYRDNPVEPPV